MQTDVLSSNDYWISPNALQITTNALGEANRIQISVASGAVIQCYKKGIIDFNVGHNPQSWPLQVYPTFFNDNEPKYAHIAIPRTPSVGTQALVVWPSHILDIYGKDGTYIPSEGSGDKQIGSEDYYYVYLQGWLKEPENGKREWGHEIVTGILGTYEDVAFPTDSVWYRYSNITENVTFLKNIVMDFMSKFLNLQLGNGNLTDVATEKTEFTDSAELVATPSYVDSQYLSKTHDDTAAGNMTFLKDVNIKGNINGVVAVLDKILSSEYTGDGMNDTGFLLQYANGRAKLVIDDLVARGKFTANELESRIWTYAGGNMIFSGAGSKIFFVEYLDANGNSLGYTNINAPWLLAGRPFLASMVAWSKRRSVKRSLTDAEKAQVVKFRCYEYSDNGTMQTRNWWHQDDLAFCQTLNHVKDKANSDGSYSGAASNSVYHRRVVSIGSKAIAALNDGRIYDYVDLSNVSGEYDPTYNDWPAAGDTIVQRGNYSDPTRRSMVTIEVTGDTRGLKVYDNIMGWYANTQQGEQPNGERYIFIGYNENTGRAKLDVHGDAYIGDPNGSTYIKYDMEDATTHRPKLHIKAEVEFTNPDDEMDEWVRGHQKKYDNEIANLESITEDLQKQIDGAIESYFMVGVPSLTTPPVMNTAQTHYEDAWLDGTETQEERIAILNKHVGDLYYDKATGHGYRFLYDDDTSTHMWTVLTDEDVTEALRIASEAQETADGKMTVYSTWNAWMKNNVNTLQYGDLFIPGSTTTQSGITYEARKAYKCISDGQAIFSELAYTDDTYAHNFDYLKEAMKGDTKVLGGLVLSHTLVMRNTDVETSVMAGINGVLNTDLTDPLMSIAAWYGGGMVDLEHLSDYWTAQQIADWEALTPAQKAASLAVAKSLDRQDGSGYRASGNLSWDKEGNLNIQGNKIKAANYYLNGVDITDKLTAIFDMFELEGEGTATSPYVIKAKHSLYSVGDVSALGHSSQGGGGGGASVLYELHDVKPDSDITPTKVYGAQTGAVLTYGSDGKWYASMPSEGVTTLAALTDVSIPNPTNGQVLMYDTSGSTPQWVAGDIPESASWGTVGTDSVQLTIGSDTKTLLTSHQSLSGYATQQWVENKGYLTSIPAATSSALGGIKVGYTTSGKNYKVQLDSSNNAYVNVPWTDNDHHDWGDITNKPDVVTKGSDGVVEVGQYLDFHKNGTTSDYSVRLVAAADSQVSINLPSSAGTLAITSQIPSVPSNISAFTNDSGYITGISSSMVVNALGYTPANSASLSNYLPLAGGTMTGTLTLRSEAYGGPTGTHGLNCKNSDIVNINSIYTNDASDGWEEGILFKRTNGNWDSIRALDGTWYFHANNGGSYAGIYAGGVYSTGDVTALSDARHKNVIGNIPLTVEQIAKMPAVMYKWIDREDGDDTHVGTLAQSWQEILPQVIKESDDTLSMNYSAAALVSGIIIARKTVSNEQRIKELEKECERLRKELEKLKTA